MAKVMANTITLEPESGPSIALNIPESAIDREPELTTEPIGNDTFIPYTSFNDEQPVKRKGGRPKGSKNKTAEPPPTLPEPEPLNVDWILVLQGINSLVIQTLGEKAGLSEIEMSLISIGAVGLTKDIPKESIKQASSLVNVVMLSLGLLLWGMRIFSEYRKQQAEQIMVTPVLKSSEPVKEQPQTQSTNPTPPQQVKQTNSNTPPVDANFMFNYSIN